LGRIWDENNIVAGGVDGHAVDRMFNDNGIGPKYTGAGFEPCPVAFKLRGRDGKGNT